MNTNRTFAAVISAAALVALGGCAVFDPGNRLAEFKYDSGNQADAVVILSAGAPTGCVGNAQSIRISDENARLHSNIEAMFVANGVAEKSLFPDHQGTIVVFHLPAGKHKLFAWPLNPTLTASNVPSTQFTVAAGEVVYLGEVFIDSACDFHVQMSFHDQFDRDMAVMKARNPVFSQLPIVKRVLTVPEQVGAK